MSGNADFFSPEMDIMKYKDNDPGLDLLGALLAVSSFHNLIYRVSLKEKVGWNIGTFFLGHLVHVEIVTFFSLSHMKFCQTSHDFIRIPKLTSPL